MLLGKAGIPGGWERDRIHENVRQKNSRLGYLILLLQEGDVLDNIINRVWEFSTAKHNLRMVEEAEQHEIRI